MAMSTCWPSPVASRWRSAARMPMTANSAELMSPRAPTGLAARRLVADEHVVVDPGHRLRDRRVRGPVGVRRPARSRNPRPRRRSTDGCDRGDVVVAQAEAVEGAGLEVLGEHVEVRCQCEHQLAAGVGLEVHGDAALREVVAQERRTDEATLGVVHPRLRAPAGLSRRGLHLHDVGAEPGEQLRRVGERLHLLEREDADAVERLAVLRRVLVRHLTEPHVHPFRRRANCACRVPAPPDGVRSRAPV